MMNIRITYQSPQPFHDRVEEYIHQELSKLNNIIAPNAAPTSIHLILAHEGHSTHLHQVEIHAILPLGTFAIRENNHDLHVALNHALLSLIHHVREAKRRQVDKNHKPAKNHTSPPSSKEESD